MPSGGSHTGFDAGSFGVGAFGGALSLSGALVAGFANAAASQRDRWANWTAHQLRAALDYSESLRLRQFKHLQAALAKNAELKRALEDRDFALKKAAANRVRGKR